MSWKNLDIPMNFKGTRQEKVCADHLVELILLGQCIETASLVYAQKKQKSFPGKLPCKRNYRMQCKHRRDKRTLFP